MTDETQQVDQQDEALGSLGRMQAALASFRQVGLPLMQALVEASGSGGEKKDTDQAAQMDALVDNAVLLSRQLASGLGEEGASSDPAVRWALAGASSQVVGASFRALGRPLAEDELGRLASIATALQEKFKTLIANVGGESAPADLGAFRARMMEAMVPVIGAVAQYAFGRAEHDLLGEVADRLVKTADQVTRSLAVPGCSSDQWRLLCWNVLRAAGQIYTECHYAEADRLLYMNATDRAAYFAKHGDVLPMTQVWQAFNQRMAMLATLATYLQIPDSAGLDSQLQT